VSNTPGNLLEIHKVSWKFSGLVCEFVINISFNFGESVSWKILEIIPADLLDILICKGIATVSSLLHQVHTVIDVVFWHGRQQIK